MWSQGIELELVGGNCRDRFVPTIRELSNSQSCENGVGSLRKQQHVPDAGSVEQRRKDLLLELLQKVLSFGWTEARLRPLLALRLSDSLCTARSISIWRWNMAPALGNSILAPLVALLLYCHPFNIAANESLKKEFENKGYRFRNSLLRQ